MVSALPWTASRRAGPICLLWFLAGCAGSESPGPATTTAPTQETETVKDPHPQAARTEIATFGAGCFWCVEAVLERLDGVIDVRSGYIGGSVENPTYQQVCTGTTGHAEAVEVTFDPQRISYETLLDWFWRLHDPTTLNQQGPDHGTQYRSAIFYHSPEQRAAAEASKRKHGASGAFTRPIVTEITEAGTFWEAEVSHQDYYRLNQRAPYCRAMITPKLEKLGLEK